MTRWIFWALLLSAACSAGLTQAAPMAYYNPTTGGLHLKNDAFYSLIAIAVYSDALPSIAKNDVTLYASIPGSVFDYTELPRGIAYLNYPATGSSPLGNHIGDVISPGVPTSALVGVWYGPGDGPARQLPIVEIPEPTTGVLAGGLVGLLAAKRRRLLAN